MGFLSKAAKTVKNVVKKAAPVIGTAVGAMYGGPVGASFGAQAGAMLGGGSSAKPSSGGGLMDTISGWGNSAYNLYQENQNWIDPTVSAAAGLWNQYDQRQGISNQNASAKQIADQANYQSQSNAREQMQFQERMAGSAHQREVADLRAAGLNPILSGTGGMGNASPSGAQGSVTTAPVQNSAAGTGAAVSIIKDLTSALNTRAQTEYLQGAQTRLTNTASSLNVSKNINTQQSSANLIAQRDVIKQNLINLQTINENLQKTGYLTQAQTKNVAQSTQNLIEIAKDLHMKGDISASQLGEILEIGKRMNDVPGVRQISDLIKAFSKK